MHKLAPHQAQLQEITTSRSLVGGLRDTINKIQEASDPKKRTELTMLLKGQADAVTARMARANGEKGVLTDQDISRATGLVPGWSSANFNKQFADQQLDLINSNFDAVERSIRQTYYGANATPLRPPPPTGNMHFTDGLNSWDIPAADVERFKAAHPNAKQGGR